MILSDKLTKLIEAGRQVGLREVKEIDGMEIYIRFAIQKYEGYYYLIYEEILPNDYWGDDPRVNHCKRFLSQMALLEFLASNEFLINIENSLPLKGSKIFAPQNFPLSD